MNKDFKTEILAGIEQAQYGIRRILQAKGTITDLQELDSIFINNSGAYLDLLTKVIHDLTNLGNVPRGYSGNRFMTMYQTPRVDYSRNARGQGCIDHERVIITDEVYKITFCENCNMILEKEEV